MLRKIHNWLLRQRWLWEYKEVTEKSMNLRGDRAIIKTRYEWEHYVLGYRSSSNFKREFKAVWSAFYRK